MTTATHKARRQPAAPTVLALEYVDTHAGAEWLGVHTDSLKHSRTTGTLNGFPAPRWLKLGGRVRYRVADLRAWIEEHAVEHAPDPAAAANQ